MQLKTPRTFTIAPALADGLSFDPSTGAISGTAGVSGGDLMDKLTREHTVTATNHSGSETACKIIVVVQHDSPSRLQASPTLTLEVGVEMEEERPEISPAGCRVVYTIRGNLPDGVTMDATTGVISGTPTTAAARSALTIEAANSGGSTTAQFDVVVEATTSVVQHG